MSEWSDTSFRTAESAVDGGEYSSSSDNTPSLASEIQEVNKPTVGLQVENGDIDAAVTECINGILENVELMQQEESHRLKKSVSFPNDGKLVMGYLDPPDPWKNVNHWTPEDLVQAYRKGCEKHAAKPLNKILQQLQGMENVGERYEILSLKGERLDLKQCESLEEIFRLVRFRCLDLEATHLDDETAVAIFEMVEFYETACKLNISFNKNIGPRGWQSCSKLVRKTPCLTFIDARNCDLNERVIPILGRSLRMGCYLTRLQLQNTNLAGKPLFYLVCALKPNETLKELFIGDNKLMPTDGVQIGNLLKYNHKLELLDLRCNHLQDVGTTHICDGIFEQNQGSGLVTLVLWSNQISFQAMSAVSRALTSTDSLETINLGHNSITNEGVHLLKDGLLKSKSLLKLGLSGTKITCEGAVALAEVIADSPRLVRLDLQENDIKTAGLMALSLALKVSESLTRLDLDKDTKKESGVKDYAEQQKRLMMDISMILDRNRELLRQRNLAKKQLELKNEENARKQMEERKAQSIESNEECAYIQSEDTIRRPKLLFLPQCSPESELDSPVCLEGGHSPRSPPVLSPGASGGIPGAMSPQVPDLLSPQYCPEIKAKKLFSVTRVDSPSLTSPAIDSLENLLTVPQICAPLPSHSAPSSSQNFVDLKAEMSDPTMQGGITTSHNMQQSLEIATLESYIQQIVQDTEGLSLPYDTEGGSNSGSKGGTEETAGVGHSVTTRTGEAVQSRHESDKAISDIRVPNSVHSTESVPNVPDSDVKVIAGTKTNATIAQESSNKGDNNSDSQLTTDDKQQTVVLKDSVAELGTGGNVPQTNICDDHVSDTSVKETLSVSGFATNRNHIPDKTNSSTSSTTYHSVSACNQDDPSKNFNDEPRNLSDLELPSLESEDGNVMRAEGTGNNQSGCQDGGDGDQWSTVEKSDIPDRLDLSLEKQRENPDFHTSLSMNGLKQELASLIDGEDNGQSVGVVGEVKVVANALQNGTGLEIGPAVVETSDS